MNFLFTFKVTFIFLSRFKPFHQVNILYKLSYSFKGKQWTNCFAKIDLQESGCYPFWIVVSSLCVRYSWIGVENFRLLQTYPKMRLYRQVSVSYLGFALKRRKSNFITFDLVSQNVAHKMWHLITLQPFSKALYNVGKSNFWILLKKFFFMSS